MAADDVKLQALEYQRVAGIICDDVLQQLTEMCIEGQDIFQLSTFGDSMIDKLAKEHFNTINKKGVSFPVCVNINNIMCNNSFLQSDPTQSLQKGDLVKLQLGCHFDGHSSLVTHSVSVGEDSPLINAAQDCMREILSLPLVGGDISQIMETCTSRAEKFNFKVLPGTGAFKLTQFGANLNKQWKTDREMDKNFEKGERYAVDVLLSSGECKLREGEVRTSVYRREDLSYSLKMKSSRQFVSDVDRRFGRVPFSLRSFEVENRAKLALKECLAHGLCEGYPVYYGRTGECIVHLQCTISVEKDECCVLTGRNMLADE